MVNNDQLSQVGEHNHQSLPPMAKFKKAASHQRINQRSINMESHVADLEAGDRVDPSRWNTDPPSPKK